MGHRLEDTAVAISLQKWQKLESLKIETFHRGTELHCMEYFSHKNTINGPFYFQSSYSVWHFTTLSNFEVSIQEPKFQVHKPEFQV